MVFLFLIVSIEKGNKNMKSKAQILVEEINKMLEEKGLPKIKEEKNMDLLYIFLATILIKKKHQERKTNNGKLYEMWR